MNDLKTITATTGKLENDYGMTFQSACTVIEAVKAWNKYENLPQATKDSIQTISDMYNVNFHWNIVRKKLVLTGISNMVRSTYLYTKETFAKRKQMNKIKNCRLITFPHTNGQLQYVYIEED